MSFKAILEGLTLRAGATGAIMLDWEGEMVDFFSTSHKLELPLIGAHKGIILSMLKDVSAKYYGDDSIESVGITTGNSRLVIFPIKEGYYLLITTGAKNMLGRTLFEAKRAIKSLQQEMG